MSVPSPVTSVKQLSISFSVSVNNSPIKDANAVLSIQVYHEVNRISYAEVVLVGDSVTSDKLPLTDGDDFVPGNTIDIAVAFGDNPKSSIFTGVIVKHGIEVNTSSTFNLKLLCKHAAVAMTFNKKEALFTSQTDSAVIQSIVNEYKLACSVDNTSAEQEGLFQKAGTDWDFVLARAEVNGFIVTMDGGKIKIGKPVLRSAPVLRVAMGESIVAFNAELNAERQPTDLDISAWDIQKQALNVKSAAEPYLNKQGAVSAKALSDKLQQSKLSVTANIPLDDASLQKWANAALLRMRLSAFKGQVTFVGNALVKTGDIILLEGVGKKFNGNAFVSAITHSLEKGTWRTTARFGLENKPISEKANFSYLSAVGQLPAIQGLQVGTVKKLSGDPLSQSRIQVQIPSGATSSEGIWVRVANFYATSGAGSFFMPETGDEVVVGFLENDPRYPVMLGALYSSAKKPAVTAEDEKNNTKSIVTREKMKINFDEEKKVITVETPGNNSIVISDDKKSITLKDQNGNTVTLDSSGITLESAKDINVKATGSCTIEANGAINIKSQQDVKTAGLNINNQAQMSFEAKANISAELSASAQTTVKGGIVMIN
jgi:Rhs element Vgr protein